MVGKCWRPQVYTVLKVHDLPGTAGRVWVCKIREDYSVSSVQSFGRVRLFATPWIAACQASLSVTISRSSLRLTSIESVMPSSHLILCRPLFLLPLIPLSITVFSNESTQVLGYLVILEPNSETWDIMEYSDSPGLGHGPLEGGS